MALHGLLSAPPLTGLGEVLWVGPLVGMAWSLVVGSTQMHGQTRRMVTWMISSRRVSTRQPLVGPMVPKNTRLVRSTRDSFYGDSFDSAGSMKLVAPGRNGIPPVIPACEMASVASVAAETCALARYHGHHAMVFGTWLATSSRTRVQEPFEVYSQKLAQRGAPPISRQLYSHMLKSHRQLSVDSEWKISLTGVAENEGGRT